MTAPVSDQGTTPTEPNPTGDDPGGQLGDGGKAALVAERSARKAAEKKAAEAQARLDEIEAKNLTETDRARKEAETAKAEAAAAKAEALRYRVAAQHQVTDEDAELFLTGTDEETLTRQAKRLVALRTPPADPQAGVIPGPRPDLSQGAKGNQSALNGDPLLQSVIAKVGARRT